MVVVKKLSAFVYFVAVVTVISWYWNAKDDKEHCLVTLDKHMQISSELKKELKGHKEDTQKMLVEKELEISNNKDALEEKQDKLGVCEEKVAGLTESLERQELLAEEKKKLLAERGEEIDKMIEKYKIIKNELVSVQTEEKKWKLERNTLKDNEQKLKNEKELLIIDIDNMKAEMQLLQNKYNDLIKLKEKEVNERKAAVDAAIVAKKQAAENEIDNNKPVADAKGDKIVIEGEKAAVKEPGQKDNLAQDKVKADKDDVIIPKKEPKDIEEKKPEEKSEK